MYPGHLRGDLTRRLSSSIHGSRTFGLQRPVSAITLRKVVALLWLVAVVLWAGPTLAQPFPTTTTLSVIPNPAFEGDPVAITVNVNSVGGLPHGTVLLTGPGGFSRTVSLDTRGTAITTTTFSVAGTVTAAYQGSAEFSPSVASLELFAKPPDPTSTTVTAAPNPSVPGQLVTLSATILVVSTLKNNPAGTVEFVLPTLQTITASVDKDGVATATTTSLITGTVFANYSGDKKHEPSEGSVDVVVGEGLVPTTTSVFATPNPTVVGAPITFTANVAAAPSAGQPSGSVRFTGPGGLDQVATVTGGGTASVSTIAVASGEIIATFTGTGAFVDSSGNTAITVAPGPTATSIAASPNPSVRGATVTFTATVASVSPSSGTPTGTVTFTQPGGLTQTVPLTAGRASVSTTTLTSGTVTAAYNGSSAHASSSGAVVVTVGPAPTTTSVIAGPNPSITGQPVTLTATVTSTASGVPTGSVLFSGPGGFSATATITGGSATVSSPALATGNVTAAYQGDALLAASQGSVTVTVGPARTTTGVTAVPDPATAGATVLVTAHVVAVPPGSGVPAGSVRFTSPGGVNETASLDGSGNAVISIPATVSETITASFAGNSAFTSSASSVHLVVNKTPTIAALVVAPNPSSVGQAVTLTATIAANTSSAGTPTGNVTFTGPGLNQTVPLAAGVATFTTSMLATGTVQVSYGGDALFSASIASTAVTVNQIATTTAVTAVPNPAVVGAPVALTATVTSNLPGGGTPSGSVTFTGPRGLTQTVALDAGGRATTTATAAVSGTLVATYSGDARFTASQETLAVTVGPGPTTTTVTAVPNPSGRGETVSVTATVAAVPPSSGTPIGTVTFTEPGGLTQTVPLVGGQAIVSTTSLATGAMTATYNGSAAHAPSTGTLAVTVNPASTTTRAIASPEFSVTGEPVTLTAIIDWTAPGTPTGSVLFTGAGGFSATAVVEADGTATLTTSALASGTVTAAYQGDALFAGSQGTVDVTVALAGTTTTVVAVPDPATAGATVSISATVVPDPPATGIPTGSVTFTSSGGINQTAPVDSSGNATISIPATASETVVADYSGSSVFRPSTGIVDLDVNKTETITTVVASPDPSSVNQDVTLTATVVAASGPTGTLTGSVTFTGPGIVATVPLSASGVATFVVSTLATGTILAEYGGDTIFAGSTGSTTVTVNKIATTTSVTAVPNPATVGASVTLTATVASNPPGGGTPTGAVTFTGPRGLTQTVVVGPAGQAVATITADAAISGTVTASYSGDSTFIASQGIVAVSVGPGPTTTSVVAAPNPSLRGDTVSIIATVAAVPPTPSPPTGTVTFTEPGGNAETVPLVAGQATMLTSALSSGTVTAVYNGSAVQATSMGTVSVTVNPALTTTNVIASPDPSVTGQPVTLTAVLNWTAPGVPTGSVQFTGPGGFSASGNVDGDGTATVTTSVLVTGSVTAAYQGDTQFADSQGSVAVTARPAGTTTGVTAVPDPATAGATVLVTAHVVVVPPGSGVPAGSVSFTSAGGVNQIATLDSSGNAVISIPATVSETITATYRGSAAFAASSGIVDLDVNKTPTVATLVAAPDPSSVGQTVTLTATIAANPSSAGTPTGSVTFTAPGGFNQTVAINASGVAVLATSTLVTGPVQANYGGDPLFAGSIASTTVTVNQIATTTTVTAAPNPVPVGASVTLTATVASNSPSGSTPTGSVTFTGPGGINQTVPLDVAGRAATTVTAATNGTVTATYNGDPTFIISEGTVAVVVDQVATTTSVEVDPIASVVGQTITVSAAVVSLQPSPLTPGGNITFSGPGGFSQVAVLDTSGTAFIRTSALDSGPVTAVYAGNATFGASQGTVSMAVVPGPTEIVLNITPNPSIPGQPVTLEATVVAVPPATGTPTGMVTFVGPRRLLETVPLVNGRASVTKGAPDSPLATGTVSATYSGSTEHAPSTTSEGMTVVQAAATETTVVAVPNPSVIGQTVTLTATVGQNPPEPGVVPAGDVVFSGPNGVSTVVRLRSDGTATLATSSLTSGTVTAAYGGSPQHALSEGAVDVVVNRGATTTVVSASPNPSRPGDEVTLTATVTGLPPASGTPTGSVAFTGPGGLNATVHLSGGTATLTTSTLTSGTLSAAYGGDASFETSAGTTDVTVEELGTVRIRVVVDGDDLVVGFTSPTPLLDLSVPVTGGTGEAGPLDLASGAYEIVVDDLSGSGYGVTAIECSDADSTVDIRARSASIALAPGEAVTCTFHLLNSLARTVALIEDFMENRGRLILANQPDLQRRIDRLNGGPAVSSNPIADLMNYVPGVIEGRALAVSTSLGAIERLAGREQQSAFDAWFDGTFAQFDTTDASGTFGLATFGADYLVSSDLLVGGFVQVDRTIQSGTTTVGQIDGTGFLVGPYATLRLVDNLYLDIIGGAGMSSNTVDPFGIYSDDFDAVRWLLSATLQGDWAIETWTFSPRARFSYFEETSDSYNDSIGVPIPSITAGFGEIAVGPGVSYEFVADEDIIVNTSVRLDALADVVNASTVEGLTDIRARLEGSVDLTFAGGATLGLSLAYDGLGSSDLNAMSAGVELSAPLD